MTRRFVLLVVVLSIISALASGQNVFYGVTGQDGVASSLYTINSTTGATTLVGATGFNGVGSLAFSPLGTLFAIAGNAAGPVHQLITINTSTGAGTAIGATGITNNITDIAFRSDGVLFAMTGRGDLYTVNTTTGAATLINSAGGVTQGGGLAFNSGNTLFLSAGSNLQTVNQATGARTNVVTMTFVSGADALVGMKFHPTSGVLYAVTFDLDSSPPSQLVTVNTSTGAMTSLGSNGLRLEAMAIGGAATTPPPPPPPTGVPIPSTLLLMITGILGLAAWLYRRRRTAGTAAF